MKVQETSVSRRSQMSELVLSTLPGLRGGGGGDEELFFYVPGKYQDYIDIKLRVVSTNGARVLFAGGEWEDIQLIVCDAKFFEGASTLGAKYESVTGKQVAIVKKF